MLAKSEPHARTRVRLLGMAHVKEGLGISDVAKALRVHETTVDGWIRRFNAQGLDGLIQSPRSGAKRKLSVEQEPLFKAAVIDLQAQRSGGRITGHDIRACSKNNLGCCCLNSVYNLLARLGLVWISVRSKHPKQSQVNEPERPRPSIGGSRWVDYDMHELLEMIGELEDERRWARLREGALWAVLIHALLLLAIFLLPKYVWVPRVIQPSISARDRKDWTYLDSPSVPVPPSAQTGQAASNRPQNPRRSFDARFATNWRETEQIHCVPVPGAAEHRWGGLHRT